MNHNALLEEIRRRNRDHLPALLAALERVKAGIRLTLDDHEAVIDTPLPTATSPRSPRTGLRNLGNGSETTGASSDCRPGDSGSSVAEPELLVSESSRSVGSEARPGTCPVGLNWVLRNRRRLAAGGDVGQCAPGGGSIREPAGSQIVGCGTTLIIITFIKISGQVTR
jgi:hypothetical protein